MFKSLVFTYAPGILMLSRSYTANNFNAIMARNAKLTIVEVELFHLVSIPRVPSLTLLLG